ncbi:MAG: protein kinase [Pseudonocardia sp.]|nr:protein kinase [Pseudonocardia sp.]
MLLDAHGPRLIDFGIARAVGSATMTITGHVIGTPSFMSPEQVESTRGIGSASDIFSFGAVIAFICTGRSPFESDSVAATLYKVAHGAPDLDGVTGPLREVARACLSRDPDARPTAAQLEATLLTDARLPVPPRRIKDGSLTDPAPEGRMPDVSAESGSPDTALRDAPRHRTVRAVGSRRRRRRLWAMGGAASIAAASVAAALFVGPRLVTAGDEVLPGPSGAAAPVTAPGQLLANVLPDECLLSVAEMSSLVERDVDNLQQGRIDGGPLGCVARVDGTPLALVNVYEVAFGSPSDVVTASAAQGRDLLDGVDQPAVLVNADAGPTLQVAGPRYLATIQVMGRTPSRSHWADAGGAALRSMPK